MLTCGILLSGDLDTFLQQFPHGGESNPDGGCHHRPVLPLGLPRPSLIYVCSNWLQTCRGRQLRGEGAEHLKEE
ncbi:BnaC08g08790D [Brassica napus]|uniref:Uncharacterized protein n=2 Tax=Brassica TaxID=3705 RepID=A0A3P6GAV0_BRAOL|nr:unnamed protein product [Brassica napus]CDY18737.1 BnaC08g08790D [Brassica napus]VDD54395.1 unnamed protein product [Brassica oleracea]